MSELIKREDAVKATWHEPSYTDAYNVLTEVRDRIEALPTVDAVPIEQIESFIDWLERNGYTLLKKAIINALHDYRADGERRTE